MEKLIYALACPVTKKIHYVGKSTQGMRRPAQHLKKSHSEKIREWVSDLQVFGAKPIISVLENVMEGDNIDDREMYWIQSLISSGATLLNENLVTPITIDPSVIEKVNGTINYFLRIGRYVKERRKIAGLTQEEFADKSGIALTVVRKIEQGKSNLALESILDVLYMFGCTLEVKRV